MLKPQDVVLLLKILAGFPKDPHSWSQHRIASHLYISASEVNAGIKRLRQSNLLRKMYPMPKQAAASSAKLYSPITKACEEFLISGVKYVFPAKLGEYTRGMATSYAAPVFKKRITLGNEPIPVWPFAEGEQRGLALEPLYPSVPKSLMQYPDQAFYDLLALVDAIRQGRARERTIAIQLLREKLNDDKSE